MTEIKKATQPLYLVVFLPLWRYESHSRSLGMDLSRSFKAFLLLLVWGWLGLAASVPQAAEPPLQESALSLQDGHLALSRHLITWVPDEPAAEAAVLAGAYDDKFAQPRQPYLVQGKQNWYRFTLHNPSAETSEWILSLRTAMVGEAVLLTQNGNQQTIRQVSGMRHDYWDRPVPYNEIAFSLHLDPEATQTYYLLVQTPFQVYFSPTLSDLSHFMKSAGLNYSLGFLFIGILMGVFVYLLVLSTGSASQVLVAHYVWFVLFAMLVMLYVNGFLMAVLPRNPWLVTNLWLLIHVGLQMSYLWITQSYFSTRGNYPRIHRYLVACMWIEGSFAVLMMFIPYTLMVSIQLYFSAQLILGMAVVSLYIWRHERARVSLFVMGNLGLLLMAALSTFSALSAKAANDWFVQHGYEIGFCWQAILFTWALSKQINLLAMNAAISEAKNKANNEFVAKISHEIRTPMNGVLGMTQLLQKTPVTEEQRHYLNVIDSSGRTLMAVISDILDYSKLAAGRMELHPEPFDLQQVLSEIKTLFDGAAENKKLSFDTTISPGIPTPLVGDSIRLRQVLTNLLSNAFKFTEQGSVSLSVYCLEDHQDSVKLQFMVRDSGIGIRQEDQKKLFSMFTRLETGPRHHYDGMGLGLSICKQLVELMGGQIVVHSRPGVGSDFIFTVRFAKSLHGKQAMMAPENISTVPWRVLVAEDNDVNQQVIGAYLQKLGCIYQLVNNGKEALEIIRQRPDDFDMVLMDCEMPVLDGISTCKQLREQERQSSKRPLPVIALTAHASPQHLKLCVQAGMNGTLVKPLSLSQLREVLSKKYP